ncbi:unnamed protein product (macronuclear) [Paramecium tetraurelia]|uniref:Uncharacterized protein n=1 Tax=Paramecium tetraurelia TaxID=5888 RepID=A0DF96_PARTE|nr:uncharacterized protein GSPATT00016526001 [Paramecium tetraurelia]CAK81713.1 unnamed protein product [Paramecium tetraurelia]
MIKKQVRVVIEKLEASQISEFYKDDIQNRELESLQLQILEQHG